MSTGLPRAPRQEAPVQRLADVGLDYGLAAHVQLRGRLGEFLKHGGREVHGHPLYWAHHLAAVREETRHVFAPVGHPGDGLGRRGLLAFTSWLHIIPAPPASSAT